MCGQVWQEWRGDGRVVRLGRLGRVDRMDSETEGRTSLEVDCAHFAI